jgi:hypothetical protein
LIPQNYSQQRSRFGADHFWSAAKLLVRLKERARLPFLKTHRSIRLVHHGK